MVYQQSIENCFTTNGATTLRDEYLTLLNKASNEADILCSDMEKVSTAFPNSLTQIDAMDLLQTLAQRHRDIFKDVVVFGVGGSSLGGRALCALGAKNGPQLHFVENIDPHTIAILFENLQLSNTGFIVISKSGETSEPLAQTLITIEKLRIELGEVNVCKHMTVITSPGESSLRTMAERYKIPIVNHDPHLGGRYSVLSVVGLLPAMIAGLDSSAVLAGAISARDAALNANKPEDNAPAVGAAISISLQRSIGAKNTVIMPYVDRLIDFAQWYRQLWAESLGKGGCGTTPITALGAVDQHSQLQLYLDGPADKFITIIVGPKADEELKFDASLTGDPRVAYLANRSLSDLMDASGRAIEKILVSHDRPIRTIRIEHVNEVTLGALLMHFMLETFLSARLIGVDPFNQPAVEGSKVLVRKYMMEL